MWVDGDGLRVFRGAEPHAAVGHQDIAEGGRGYTGPPLRLAPHAIQWRGGCRVGGNHIRDYLPVHGLRVLPRGGCLRVLGVAGKATDRETTTNRVRLAPARVVLPLCPYKLSGYMQDAFK